MSAAWISVDERLPAEFTSVLACNGCGFIGRASIEHGRWNHIGKPTHWMPMPALPGLERTLPASDTITLDSLETSEAEARTPGALWLDLPKPRFVNVICSNCGSAFGPGDSGFSHCESHKHLRAISWQEERALERLP